MSTGDTGDGGNSSQNITALNGKILRLNLDGTVPADNPDNTSLVYSWDIAMRKVFVLVRMD